MKKTRVEKYEEYRKEIDAMDFEDETPVKKEEIERIKQNALTQTAQDLMGKYDEYTILVDNAEISEKKRIEENRRKKEKKAKIKFICICALLTLIIIAIVICIIFVILGGIK